MGSEMCIRDRFITVALVTVGYGDLIPMTNLGRCITVAAMLMGVIVIALPITVVGSTFRRAYSDMKDKAERANGSSSSEAALFMSAVCQASGCHAQQGCRGVMRPTRVKDQIIVGRSLVPKDCGDQEECAKRHMEDVCSAQGSGRQQVVLRSVVDASQNGQRSGRRASLVANCQAAKV